MINKTAGHRQDSAGVRGHSAGDIFPAVIMIKGNFSDGFTYHVLNHPFIPCTVGYNRYSTAHTTAAVTPRSF